MTLLIIKAKLTPGSPPPYPLSLPDASRIWYQRHHDTLYSAMTMKDDVKAPWQDRALTQWAFLKRIKNIQIQIFIIYKYNVYLFKKIHWLFLYLFLHTTRCKIHLAMIIDKEKVKIIEFCFYYQMGHVQIIWQMTEEGK